MTTTTPIGHPPMSPAAPTAEQRAIRDDYTEAERAQRQLNRRIARYLRRGGSCRGLARAVGVTRQSLYSRARSGGWAP